MENFEPVPPRGNVGHVTDQIVHVLRRLVATYAIEDPEGVVSGVAEAIVADRQLLDRCSYPRAAFDLMLDLAFRRAHALNRDLKLAVQASEVPAADPSRTERAEEKLEQDPITRKWRTYPTTYQLRAKPWQIEDSPRLIARIKRFLMVNHPSLSPTDVDDIAQDTWIAALRADETLASLGSPAHVELYLRRIAINKLFTFWRKSAQRKEVPLEGAEESDALARIESAYSEVELALLVGSLHSDHRAMVHLFLDNDGHDHVEAISAHFNITRDNARQRWHRLTIDLRNRWASAYGFGSGDTALAVTLG